MNVSRISSSVKFPADVSRAGKNRDPLEHAREARSALSGDELSSRAQRTLPESEERYVLS
ncbi:hypothetical protein COCCU_06670 [Corynebacterium occultum]|uniref:Uncharacterized protein n=1 Tax=Corynebacterium occultum TaxID=2675219 RepID=A0A6B8VNY7_9CORY|nr:hypothetical protein COCCU_06670 [Corynebacterium occultum]